MKTTLVTLLFASTLTFGTDFIANPKNHTVEQKSAKLIWQDDVSSAERVMSYKSGMAYCETLDYAGSTNWRIPIAKELYSTINPNRTPTINLAFFHTASECYWTLSDQMKGHVGMIDFSNGMKKSANGLEQYCHIRCVSDLK